MEYAVSTQISGRDVLAGTLYAHVRRGVGVPREVRIPDLLAAADKASIDYMASCFESGIERLSGVR